MSVNAVLTKSLIRGLINGNDGCQALFMKKSAIDSIKINHTNY